MDAGLGLTDAAFARRRGDAPRDAVVKARGHAVVPKLQPYLGARRQPGHRMAEAAAGVQAVDAALVLLRELVAVGGV